MFNFQTVLLQFKVASCNPIQILLRYVNTRICRCSEHKICGIRIFVALRDRWQKRNKKKNKGSKRLQAGLSKDGGAAPPEASRLVVLRRSYPTVELCLQIKSQQPCCISTALLDTDALKSRGHCYIAAWFKTENVQALQMLALIILSQIFSNP